MLHIQTAAHISEVDHLTSEKYAIKSLILMENAAVRSTIEIERQFGPMEGKRVRLFCGKGNNGGDGAAVARQLWMRGALVEVLLFGKREVTRGDARANIDMIFHLSEVEPRRIGFKEIISIEDFSNAVKPAGEPVALHVDALFGTGLKRGLSGMFEDVIAFLNSRRSDRFNPIPVCSLDIPSGLAADQANRIGPCVEADLTVTFTAAKPANVLPPACDHNGKLVVVPIGSPRHLLKTAGDHKSQLSLIEKADVAKMLRASRRPPGAHKGTVGHVLVAAGSRGKTGAAALTALAVLRAGAGLVTVVTPRSAQHFLVANGVPEMMTLGMVETEKGAFSEQAVEPVLEMLAERTVLAIGPGLTAGEDTTKKFIYDVIERSTKPIVIDADGLNALSPWPESLKGSPERPIILTPHPGEMCRLTGLSTKTLLRNRDSCARALAKNNGLYVVLKGHRTLIAGPDGEVYINPTGNPGMGTAGSGDVLTGVVAGMLAQTPASPLEATLSAVYLHGLAGDKASTAFGQRALMASDITNRLHEAFLEFEPML
ncbi:MAG: NAD(P)H-hydrate dehydratase [Blastocatellia bacterium]|nr:NAD(P)H-hydrate dehydratase [Blastocatellia bacterium]